MASDSAEIARKVAAVLKEARRRAGLTQEAAAQAAGLQQAGVARMESGTTLATIDTLARLLDGEGYDLRFVVSRRSEQIEVTLN